jgi:glucose-1-phosphate cytidylyltransferase
MCGGRGLRLRPLTDEIPKPLVQISGKPVLQHLLESYIRKGFNEFVLCIGYRGQMIRDLFANNMPDAKIEFSDAGEDASILQRLHLAKNLTGDRFFVSYGDTLIDVELDEMLRQHLVSGASATITAANVKSPFGLITTDESHSVRSFQEKPTQMYFVGHMLLERTVLDGVDPKLLAIPDGDGLVKLFQVLISQNKLNMYQYSGAQITFNTHRELDQAEQDFISFFTHQEEEPCR